MLGVLQSLFLVLGCYIFGAASQQYDLGIDFLGCYRDLDSADLDRDGFVKSNEYLFFIQNYGKRLCFSTDALTLRQYSAFNTIACRCQSQEGSATDCCVGSNANIPTAGASLPIVEQTPSQRNFLTYACTLTHSTIDARSCPPSTNPSNSPSFAPSSAPSSARSNLTIEGEPQPPSAKNPSNSTTASWSQTTRDASSDAMRHHVGAVCQRILVLSMMMILATSVVV